METTVEEDVDGQKVIRRSDLQVLDGGHWDVLGELLPAHEDAVVAELREAARLDWQYAVARDQHGEPIPLSDRRATLELVRSVVTTLSLRAGPRGVLQLGAVEPTVGRHYRPDLIWRAAPEALSDEPASDRIRFVQDLQQGPDGWRAVQLPAEARQLLTVVGHTAARAGAPVRAARLNDLEPGWLHGREARHAPPSLDVPFQKGETSTAEILSSWELVAVAQWLAEAVAEAHASGSTPPSVAITGHGNGRLGRRETTAQDSGRRRAETVRGFLAGELATLGLDAATVDQILPMGLLSAEQASDRKHHGRYVEVTVFHDPATQPPDPDVADRWLQITDPARSAAFLERNREHFHASLVRDTLAANISRPLDGEAYQQTLLRAGHLVVAGRSGDAEQQVARVRLAVPPDRTGDWAGHYRSLSEAMPEHEAAFNALGATLTTRRQVTVGGARSAPASSLPPLDTLSLESAGSPHAVSAHHLPLPPAALFGKITIDVEGLQYPPAGAAGSAGPDASPGSFVRGQTVRVWETDGSVPGEIVVSPLDDVRAGYRVRQSAVAVLPRPPIVDFSHVPLFDKKYGLSAADTVQGRLGDCYLIAALGSLSKADPTLIEGLFTENADGTVDIALYRARGGSDVPFMAPEHFDATTPVERFTVTVDKRLYARPERPDKAQYAQAGPLWPALIEKAFAVVAGGYWELDSGFADPVWHTLTGRPAAAWIVNPARPGWGGETSWPWHPVRLNARDLQRKVGLKAAEAEAFLKAAREADVDRRPGVLADLESVVSLAPESAREKLREYALPILEGPLGSGRYSEFAVHVYTLLKRTLEKGGYATFGTNSWGRAVSPTGADPVPGLRSNHEYTILGATTKDSRRFLRLRNPHGRFGRTYRASGSSLVPEADRKAGEFDLELSDVMRYGLTVAWGPDDSPATHSGEGHSGPLSYFAEGDASDSGWEPASRNGRHPDGSVPETPPAASDHSEAPATPVVRVEATDARTGQRVALDVVRHLDAALDRPPASTGRLDDCLPRADSVLREVLAGSGGAGARYTRDDTPIAPSDLALGLGGTFTHASVSDLASLPVGAFTPVWVQRPGGVWDHDPRRRAAQNQPQHVLFVYKPPPGEFVGDGVLLMVETQSNSRVPRYILFDPQTPPGDRPPSDPLRALTGPIRLVTDEDGRLLHISHAGQVAAGAPVTADLTTAAVLDPASTAGPRGTGPEIEATIVLTNPDGTVPLLDQRVIATAGGRGEGWRFSVDHREFLIGRDGRLYDPDDPPAGVVFVGRREYPIIELVLPPLATLPGEQQRRVTLDDLWHRLGPVFARLENAPIHHGHSGAGERPTTVASLFPRAEGWEFESRYEAVGNLHAWRINDDNRLYYLQATVGVPAAGLDSFLQSLTLDRRTVDVDDRNRITVGRDLGTRAAARYLGLDPSVDPAVVDALSGIPGVAELRGYVALVYTQAAAVLAERLIPDDVPVLVKNKTAVALRNPISAGRRALSPEVARFLEGNVRLLTKEAMESFAGTEEGAPRNLTWQRMAAEPITVVNRTVADYMEDAFVATSRADLDPNDVLGVNARANMYPQLDSHGNVPLFIIEIRNVREPSVNLDQAYLNIQDVQQLSRRAWNTATAPATDRDTARHQAALLTNDETAMSLLTHLDTFEGAGSRLPCEWQWAIHDRVMDVRQLLGLAASNWYDATRVGNLSAALSGLQNVLRTVVAGQANMPHQMWSRQIQDAIAEAHGIDQQTTQWLRWLRQQHPRPAATAGYLGHGNHPGSSFNGAHGLLDPSSSRWPQGNSTRSGSATGSAEVSREMRTAVAGLPDVDARSAPVDCALRVRAVLTDLGARLRNGRDDGSGQRDTDTVAGLLGGRSWGATDVSQLTAMPSGSVTAVWVEQPNNPMHLVLVERTRDGRYVQVETQARGEGAFVEFDPRGWDGDGPAPVVLAAPVRLVVDDSDHLGCFRLPDGATGRTPRQDTGEVVPNADLGVTVAPRGERLERQVAAIVRPYAGNGSAKVLAELGAEARRVLTEPGATRERATELVHELARRHEVRPTARLTSVAATGRGARVRAPLPPVPPARPPRRLPQPPLPPPSVPPLNPASASLASVPPARPPRRLPQPPLPRNGTDVAAQQAATAVHPTGEEAVEARLGADAESTEDWFIAVLDEPRIRDFVQFFGLVEQAGPGRPASAPGPERAAGHGFFARLGNAGTSPADVLDADSVGLLRYTVAAHIDGADRSPEDRFVGLLHVLRSIREAFGADREMLTEGLTDVIEALEAARPDHVESGRTAHLLRHRSVHDLGTVLGEELFRLGQAARTQTPAEHRDQGRAPASEEVLHGLQEVQTNLMRLSVAFHSAEESDRATARFEQTLRAANDLLGAGRPTDGTDAVSAVYPAIRDAWGTLQVLRGAEYARTRRRQRSEPAFTAETTAGTRRAARLEPQPSGPPETVTPWELQPTPPTEGTSTAPAVSPAAPATVRDAGERWFARLRSPLARLFSRLAPRLPSRLATDPSGGLRIQVTQTVTTVDDEGKPVPLAELTIVAEPPVVGSPVADGPAYARSEFARQMRAALSSTTGRGDRGYLDRVAEAVSWWTPPTPSSADEPPVTETADPAVAEALDGVFAGARRIEALAGNLPVMSWAEAAAVLVGVRTAHAVVEDRSDSAGPDGGPSGRALERIDLAFGVIARLRDDLEQMVAVHPHLVRVVDETLANGRELADHLDATGWRRSGIARPSDTWATDRWHAGLVLDRLLRSGPYSSNAWLAARGNPRRGIDVRQMLESVGGEEWGRGVTYALLPRAAAERFAAEPFPLQVSSTLDSDLVPDDHQVLMFEDAHLHVRHEGLEGMFVVPENLLPPIGDTYSFRGPARPMGRPDPSTVPSATAVPPQGAPTSTVPPVVPRPEEHTPPSPETTLRRPGRRYRVTNPDEPSTRSRPTQPQVATAPAPPVGGGERVRRPLPTPPVGSVIPHAATPAERAEVLRARMRSRAKTEADHLIGSLPYFPAAGPSLAGGSGTTAGGEAPSAGSSAAGAVSPLPPPDLTSQIRSHVEGRRHPSTGDEGADSTVVFVTGERVQIWETDPGVPGHLVISPVRDGSIGYRVPEAAVKPAPRPLVTDFAGKPLYEDGKEPFIEDLIQGAAGDCYLLAALGSMVALDPKLITDLITEHDDGTVSVAMYRSAENGYVPFMMTPQEYTEGRMARFSVRIDKRLYTRPTGDGKAVYARAEPLWPALVEKAFAVVAGSYRELRGGHADRVWHTLTGQPGVFQFLDPLQGQYEDIRVGFPTHPFGMEVAELEKIGLSEADARSFRAAVKGVDVAERPGILADLDAVVALAPAGARERIREHSLPILEGPLGTGRYSDFALHLYKVISDVLENDGYAALATRGWRSSGDGTPLVPGLVPNHAYTILDISSRGNQKFVTLRNPQGWLGRRYGQTPQGPVGVLDVGAVEFDLELSDVMRYADELSYQVPDLDSPVNEAG